MVQRQFITFTIDTREYGVDIMAIREIKGWTDTTELPNTPPHVRGVINLRGAIVPIFDLRARFGGALTKPSPRHVIMVLSVRNHLLGILADAVADIVTVTATEIQPVPDLEQRDDGRVLAGLVSVEERMVALIDLDRMFDTDLNNTSVNTAA